MGKNINLAKKKNIYVCVLVVIIFCSLIILSSVIIFHYKSSHPIADNPVVENARHERWGPIIQAIESSSGENILKAYGKELLLEASIQGKIDIASLIIEKGINPDIKNDAEITPLLAAVNARQVDMVKFLLTKVKKNDEEDPYGRTALQNAADLGPPVIVEMLLKSGADVNKRTRKGWTALHKTLMAQGLDSKERMKIVELLIENKGILEPCKFYKPL